MEYYYAFKNGLKLILHNFGSFLKKLYVIIFIYGLAATIPAVVSLLILLVLSNIPGVDLKIVSLIIKIILTVGQIIPLSIYLSIAENELKQRNEDAPELCFAVCAAVITWIWTCL